MLLHARLQVGGGKAGAEGESEMKLSPREEGYILLTIAMLLIILGLTYLIERFA